MNFNSLSSNEKLAVYGSIAAIVGVLIASFLAGLAWVTLLAGIAMLVVVFLPQLSAGTALPGSKGSLMFLIGLIAGVGAVLQLLFSVANLGAYFGFYVIQTLFLLIGVAGGLVMAWAGWQEFQAEGGKFNVGTTGTGSTAAGSTAAGPPPRTDAPSSTSAGTTGMGSTGPASTSVGSTSAGSTDMGSEGGTDARRDDEDTLRNP